MRGYPLVVCIVLTCIVALGPARADPVQHILNQVTLDEFQSYLRVLTGVDPVPGDPPVYLTNRYSFGQDIHVAAQWIRERFAALGLNAALQNYDPSYGPNVVGELLGQTHPQDIYIICGHYDTYHAGDQLHAPGCDDNGSGTAAVLLAAHLLAPYEFEGTLRFVAFSGEEQWMVGSQAYAAAAQAAGENIVAAINLDMFLHPGWDNANPDPDYDIDIGGNNASQWIAQYLAGTFAAYTTIAFQVHNDSGFVSDQWAFWQYGYEAVGLIENTPQEIWGGSNDAYHQLADVLTNPDYDWGFALQVVQGSLAGLIDLAGLLLSAGDLNCDGSLNAFDIDPFVLALTSTAPDYPEYYDVFPNCDRTLADCNGDGSVDAFDIDPFVDLLTGG